eukprot:2523408-Pleurochrysis_carterae.AAC.2
MTRTCAPLCRESARAVQGPLGAAGAVGRACAGARAHTACVYVCVCGCAYTCACGCVHRCACGIECAAVTAYADAHGREQAIERAPCCGSALAHARGAGGVDGCVRDAVARACAAAAVGPCAAEGACACARVCVTMRVGVCASACAGACVGACVDANVSAGVSACAGVCVSAAAPAAAATCTLGDLAGLREYTGWTPNLSLNEAHSLERSGTDFGGIRTLSLVPGTHFSGTTKLNANEFRTSCRDVPGPAYSGMTTSTRSIRLGGLAAGAI